ncbi:serine/threonine protein phosphatase [Planosporangium sp. 12N6]|uniref:serine/threonine protein phosphatase n=1 Tax=Planosporangium spinosum TaxID=3402278 RepID=UPI003CECEAB7
MHTTDSGTPDAGMSHDERVSRHQEVSRTLASYRDRHLDQALAHARALGSGIGGTSALLHVGDVPVFVKRIPLTDLERHPDNVMSTANLFGLPPMCQYGVVAVGSPGFGAWRELAAHTTTTEWVLAGRSAAFPLLYHWRVRPGAPPPADEHADIERAVAYWGGSPAVRDRLHALARASASLVLFAEFVPHTLRDWLAAQVTAGPDAVAAACVLLESRLPTDLAFLNTNGLMHFDAHFGNILTDGRRLYLTDFGLATSPRFDLSTQETDFLARNRTHDLGYALMGLVNWLVTTVCGIPVPRHGGPARRNEYIRACAAGAEPVGAPPRIAATIRRYAPVAAAMNDFYWDLFGVSRATPYPTETVERTLRAIPGLAYPPTVALDRQTS